MKATARYLVPLAREAAPDLPPRLDITVVSTTAEGTLAALATVRRLWRNLDRRITVIVPVVVQFPAQLGDPPISKEFLESKLCAAAARDNTEEIHVNVLLCRDPVEATRDALKPRSMVVIGGRRHWWPTCENALAKALRKAGHCIVFADSEAAAA
jgi:hypothetical protein